MNRQDFFKELQELFELEDELTESTGLEIDSLELLSLIAFLDEYFSVQKTAEELQDISSVLDIINLVGEDNLY
tara:strand:+ start:299 stop:517 length:219 start_codon:yes stop_codon:yes gene_type:complete